MASVIDAQNQRCRIIKEKVKNESLVEISIRKYTLQVTIQKGMKDEIELTP